MKPGELMTTFCPRQQPSIIKRQVDGQIELTHPDQKQTTILNASANAVWDLCDGKRTIADISAMLGKQYSVPVADIYSEVEDCVASLLAADHLLMDSPWSETDLHPDTNIDEGHLGGYIRGRQSADATVCEYEHGDPATWCPDLWLWAYHTLDVRSVIDIGCGEGHAARYFRDLGCEVLGIDGSEQAKRDSLINEQHITHDFNRGPYHPTADFDLAWSCEFVEHVEERYMNNFLDTFAHSKRYLMMTFASPGQTGFHHVNCQDIDYWVENVEAAGFLFDPALTQTTRAISPPGHYKSKGLFFTRQ